MACEAATLLKAAQDKELARMVVEEANKAELRRMEDIISVARLKNARLTDALADAERSRQIKGLLTRS
jgi:hypothetical protein